MTIRKLKSRKVVLCYFMGKIGRGHFAVVKNESIEIDYKKKGSKTP